MSKGDLIEMEGVVKDALGGGQYSVLVIENNTSVRVRLSGKMRTNHIRVIPGDRVRIGMSPYDLTNGLILTRHRQ